MQTLPPTLHSSLPFGFLWFNLASTKNQDAISRRISGGCKGELGLVYTMDHEFGPGLYKATDWMPKLSRDNFGLHLGKIVIGTMKVEVPKIQFLRPNKCIDMVQWVLRWKRQERWYGRKRQGPMAEKCHFNKILMNLLSMHLNHIIAHETYHYHLALPLKPAPTCFTKQRGTSKTQEFECRFVFLLYQLQCLEFGGL